MKYKLLIFWILLAITPFKALAQNYNATAHIDSTKILIGDQLNVKLTITAPEAANIIIPQLNAKSLDTLGIDWISNSAIDTTKENGISTYHQSITITAFDSGYYAFPPIEIRSVDSQVLTSTQPLYFEVQTIQVDTTAAFRDIKQPAKEMLTFKEVLPYLLLALAAALVIALALFLFKKFYHKKSPKKVLPKTLTYVKRVLYGMSVI